MSAGSESTSRKTGKVRPVHGKGVRTKSERAQTRFGFRQFDGIDIEADKPAARLERWEECDRMAAIAERAIHGEFARLRSKNFHDLANHDRPMRAGRRLAAGDDLGDVAGITLRRMLFVLFRKVSRILSAVPRPPLGFFRTHRPSRISSGTFYRPRR